MHHGDALERQHLQVLLDQAYRELDRRAEIITLLADQLYNRPARPLAPEPHTKMIRRWSEREGWHYVQDQGTDVHDHKDAA